MEVDSLAVRGEYLRRRAGRSFLQRVLLPRLTRGCSGRQETASITKHSACGSTTASGETRVSRQSYARGSAYRLTEGQDQNPAHTSATGCKSLRGQRSS